MKEIAEYCQYFQIGCHVDCSYSTFLINFENSSYTDPMDAHFKTPGITSINLSTSKYGLGPAGASVILYNHRKLRRYQYFTTTKWNGGIYFTPNLTGSRYGSAIAGTWVKMLTVGKRGYQEKADSGIILKTMDLRSRLIKLQGVNMITPSALSILAFNLINHDTYDMADFLRARGWNVVNTINPAAVSYTVTNGKSMKLIL